MKKNKHEKYYVDNKNYSDFLETQSKHNFDKYVDAFIQYSKNNDSLLDVGCGTGIALEMIKEKGARKAHGVEISNESIKVCKKKKLNCKLYDGHIIPFEDKKFDVVGSKNTLEHTDDPIGFLNESLRVLKKGGYLIITCPNFLSITNGYHHHTAGIVQKLQNIVGIFLRLLKKTPSFDKMEVIIRENFQADDDACNVTNQQDIAIWAKKNKLTHIHTSAHQIQRGFIMNTIDKTPLKVFFGSCFMIYKK